MSTGEAGPRHFPEENRQPPRPQQVKLTKEEIAVLRECNRESFWYRCIPLGATFAALTHIAVTRGILKPGARYGSVGKCIGASFVGYIAGKISYQGKCREKIMHLENSPLAQAMRAGKRGTEVMHELAVQEMTGQGYPAPSNQDSRVGTDYHNSLDFDTDRNVSYQGLDDSQRPSLDNEQGLGLLETAPSGPSSTTYDDLRRQNRAQYAEKRARSADDQEPAQRPLPPLSSGLDLPPPPSSSSMYSPGIATRKDDLTTKKQSSNQPQKRVQRNQYGDIVED